MCVACRDLPRKGPFDCEGCEYQKPDILPRNHPVVWVYERLAPGLIDGMGGVNLPGIEAGFKILRVPPLARPEILQKLLILISESRKKVTENG
jgi:hypothetical protein